MLLTNTKRIWSSYCENVTVFVSDNSYNHALLTYSHTHT